MSVRHAILGFLSIRPLSGYDLKQAFDSSIRHFWSADQATIYRALHEIEHEGLARVEVVPGEGRPDRKLYHLTDAGQAALDAWLPEPPATPPRREPLLMKLFFASRLSVEARRALVARELAATEAELATYAAILPGMDPCVHSLPDAQLVGPLLTLEAGIESALLTRAWLRALQATLDGPGWTAADTFARLTRRLEG